MGMGSNSKVGSGTMFTMGNSHHFFPAQFYTNGPPKVVQGSSSGVSLNGMIDTTIQKPKA